MRRLSPRSRRQLRALSFAGLAVCAAVLTVVLVPSRDPPRSNESSPGTAAAPAVLPAPEAAPLATTPAVRREIVETARLFIESSVRRDHPERSFSLIHPSLRQGLSRAQWKTGNIPVIPFPAIKVAEWKIDKASVDDVLMEVMLVPRQNSGLLRKTFLIELRHAHGGKHWLVASWTPYGLSQAQMEYDAAARGEPTTVEPSAHLSSLWLLVPLAILMLVVIAPITVFSVDALRGRRSRRRYERELLLGRTETGSSSTTRPS